MSEPPIERLAESPLFAGVSARQRMNATNGALTRRLAAGDKLLVGGEWNTSLFVVLDGAVDVVLPGIGAAHLRLGPGECVGELSVIGGQPVSADVVAVEPSIVLELDDGRLWSLVDASATFARNLLRTLADRVRQHHASLASTGDERRRFERLAMVDGITTLHNRRWLDEMFPLQMARLAREGRRCALLIADIDRFQAVNDELGHAVGDAVLRRIGRVLLAGLRPGDLLARYGGEEFALLIADVTADVASDVADRLRRLVAESASEGAPLCTVSVGVARMQPDEAFEALVARAHAALSRAKTAGGNRVSV